MMFRDTFGTSDEVVRFSERWCGDPRPITDSGAGGIAYSIWEPEPGLLMLAIRLWPPARPSVNEPSIVIDRNGRHGPNGTDAGRGGHLAFPEAPCPQAIIKEGKEAGGQESGEICIELILPGDHTDQRAGRLDFPGLSIDPATRRVEACGHKVELTRREFELLYFLARHQRQVFSRSQLLDCVWGWDLCIDESTVTVHVSRLRYKLSCGTNDLDPIQTVWGVGYRFEPPNIRV